MRTSKFLVFAVFCVLVLAFSVAVQAQPPAASPDAMKTLMDAMKQNDAVKVKEVLNKQPEVAKAKDEKGATALHMLAGMGLPAPQPSAPPAAAATPADKEAAVKAREGALKKAAAAQQDIAKALLEKGADVNAEDAAGNTPLLMLLTPLPPKPGEKAPDIEQTKEALKTQEATLASQKDMISLLLGKGANVNAQDKAGATPLHKVVAVPAPGMPKVAPENQADAAKMEELRKKVMEQQLGIADMLVKKGADVNAKDKAGATPKARAQRAERQDMLDLLKMSMPAAAPAPAPKAK